VLVVQMCRIGDILMTGPLLRGLKNQAPGAEVSLLVMDAFGHVPLPSSLYDSLIRFPLTGLASTLADPAGGHVRALDELRAFVRDVFAEPYDLVVNLTHTEVSGLVTSLVPARKRRGVVMTEQRQLAIDGGWMTYVRAAARSRELSCFHLVDLFAWTAGVGRDARGLDMAITPEADAWADDWLRAQGATTPPVAMQLGASEIAKQWPVERFAAIADRLPPEAGDVLLLGVEAERELASRFTILTSRRVIDGVGASSLDQLAALLRRSRLLVTNDTGTMHVATAAGTRVVDMSAGPVCAHETGPYGDGHLVVEPQTACFPCPVGAVCHHHTCRSEVSPDDAAAVVRYVLGLGAAPAIAGARLLTGHRTRSGRIAFMPLDPRLVNERDRIRAAAAEMWEQTLDVPARSGAGWQACEASELPAAGMRDDLASQCDQIAKVADAAAALIKSMPLAPPARQRTIAEGAHARLERLLAWGESERACHAIVTFLRYELESIQASDLAGLARAQVVAYSAAARRARLLGAKLRQASAEPDETAAVNL
jgi:ADP-heptose:LPS heptosyltransferase